MTAHSPPPNVTVPTAPPPTTHTVPTATSSFTTPQILSLLVTFEPVLITLAIGIVAIIIVLLIGRSKKASARFLRVDYRNADALFIVVNPKTERLVVVPAKQHSSGLFIGVYNNDYYVIATKPSVAPFQLINISKPVYFAIGDSMMFTTISLETLSGVSIVKTFSDKSISEIIGNIIGGMSQLEGKIPIANAYKLAIAIDMTQALLDDLISFQVSSATSFVNMVTSISQELRKLEEIALAREKLKSLSKQRLLYILMMAGIMMMLVGFIIYYFLSHHT